MRDIELKKNRLVRLFLRSDSLACGITVDGLVPRLCGRPSGLSKENKVGGGVRLYPRL